MSVKRRESVGIMSDMSGYVGITLDSCRTYVGILSDLCRDYVGANHFANFLMSGSCPTCRESVGIMLDMSGHVGIMLDLCWDLVGLLLGLCWSNPLCQFSNVGQLSNMLE